MQTLTDYLHGRIYPGRGIVLGLSPDGTHARLAYFIMGRSPNSRNRVFAPTADGLFTQAANEALVEDPSLILYRAVQRLGEAWVVTNGEQTDTIAAALARGQGFADALRRHTFEPDAPVFTPRISGLLRLGLGGFAYTLSILKSEGAGQAVRRFFFEYPRPRPGVGHLLHTYDEGEGLPSFAGEPAELALEGDLDTFGQGLWQSLNADNKVSLYVSAITLEGEQTHRFYNKYDKI